MDQNKNNSQSNNENTTISTMQVLKQHDPQRETSGKRKERTYGPTYNSNEDDKAGRSSNNYFAIGLSDVNRRKKNHEPDNNELDE